jgi:hypothetical protein
MDTVGAAITPTCRSKPLGRVATGSFLDFLFIPIALAAYFKE